MLMLPSGLNVRGASLRNGLMAKEFAQIHINNKVNTMQSFFIADILLYKSVSGKKYLISFWPYSAAKEPAFSRKTPR